VWSATQLNLVHATKNKKCTQKEETKTNKRQCPLSPVQVQRSAKEIQKEPERLWSMEVRICERCVLSLQ